jgi:hypothetical protein
MLLDPFIAPLLEAAKVEEKVEDRVSGSWY